MNKSLTGSALVVTMLLSACAEPPNQVGASYVSPTIYQGRSCAELTTQRAEIVSQVSALADAQRKAATSDAISTGVALVLFWPAIFALALTDDEADELSAAKGNYDAIETQMKTKGCKLPEPAPLALSPVETEKKKRSWE